MKIRPIVFMILCLLSVSGYSQGKVEYPSFGSGIRFQTSDNTGSIKMSARIQNLMVVEQALPASQGNPDLNAMVRRARLKFSGHALTPDFTYKIELGLSNRDTRYASDDELVGGTARIILDAVVKYEFIEGTSIWFGQTKLPGNRERVISSQKLQFVDRSLLNSRFNIDRDFGFQLHSEYELGGTVVRFAESVSMGEGRNIIATNQGNLDYSVRAEFLPFGYFTNKGDYFGSDLEREATPKLSIGVTGDYNQDAIRQGGQLGRIMVDSLGNYITSDLSTILADMMFKFKGFSWMTEAAYRESNHDNYQDARGNAYRQGFAYSTQAGYLFKSNIELAGRYTRIAPLKNEGRGSVEHREQYTLGCSKYFIGHNLKIQTDITYERSLGYTFAAESLMFRLQTELSF